ncbi:GNAT family N-acetyltransferase [Solirubrobacter sp. CPCC 204708]|uniref:GNAT family N-acetyltransferase n=1 Tax=Solirubrobacter deserti TaxID=2282478 RepID=A0ABT4RKC9_9ACTN|nr:GNAT family N-acetyltransferase [Solirubrobacter deserti]MBE2316870.1 GNAT family N-acetyltransferase [Solirubrobacter deserti]MDA0138913.1 GNAT family N-acetyltransferase [Solirubrobacter deserti]
MPELRPMRVEDVEEVHELNLLTFEALSASRDEPPEPRPDPAQAHIRYRHLATTDPEGAWVAEHDGAIVGCALALRREDVWGLSLLIVRPDMQSSGTGSALLRRANEYAAGARGRIILASPDPRALRAYSRLGLDFHPSASAFGTPRVTAPGGIVEGDAGDIPLTETVDRHVRGAAHGVDIGAQLEMGQTLLIAPERGYAVVPPGGGLRLLAARDEDAAADLLRAALARAESEMMVEWLTSSQQWAIRVCVEAGLELRAGTGGVFVSGEVGPFRPYLPSGAFL